MSYGYTLIREEAARVRNIDTGKYYKLLGTFKLTTDEMFKMWLVEGENGECFWFLANRMEYAD